MSSSSSPSLSPPSAMPPLPSPFSDGGGASAVRDRRLPPPAAVDAASSPWTMASLFPTPSLANLKSPTLARSDGVSSTLEEACRPPLSPGGHGRRGGARRWRRRRGPALGEGSNTCCCCRHGNSAISAALVGHVHRLR
uniref:Uncharacterized protein n=1 Tax=Oryza glaberrima TaxID=4538 RepID=I1PV78_ORYGL